MSLFEISKEFVTFFLNGADTSIIDWFASVLALGLAGGVLALILKPLYYVLSVGRKK